MQSLSVWPPPMGDFCRVPPVEFHLGHSYCVVIARKRRSSMLSRGNSRDFGDGFCDKSVRFDFGNGCFSRFRVFLSPRVGKSSMGVSAHIDCPSVEQAVGDDLGAEDMASRTLNTTVDCLKIDGLSSDGIGSSDDGKKVNGGSGCIEEVVKDNSRVDVLALAQRLQSAKSAEDVERLLKDKGELPLQVYSSMIRGFGREKKLEAAIALVEWLKRKRDVNEGFEGPNLFIYNSLLGAVKQSGQFELVDSVMNDVVEDGMSPNIVTYNTLMTIYVEQGRALEALSLFKDIQAKGLVPSPVSYSTALLAYRRTEDGFGALRFFLELREKFIKGEILMSDHKDWEGEFSKLQNFTGRICFQVMRQWIVKDESRTTSVLKLLIELDKAGLPPSIAEHEKLIWACTREEHYTVAKELYVRIRERHSDISLSVCNHVIWLMGRAKKWWAALEIYENLLDKGPKPNNLSYELIVSHFNILLTAARKRGIWRWGVRLLNKMESKGLKPGSKEWNAVLVACSKAAETQAAVQIFKRMVEQGEKPTVISYGALLSALEKGKLYEEAIRVWEHMLKVGIKPNLYAYTIMASIYVGLGRFKVVELIIQEMISTENKPTVVTFNAIISGCARNGWGGVAYEWFHRMKAMNVEPNKVTYEMLIEALAKDGKPKLAYELYLRARNEGDSEVALAAIVALGLIGAGTNNARIAAMLRNLSSYYYKDAASLFCVRIAQGLVHLGKGLLTLNPYHSDRFLLSPTALAGLTIVLHSCLDMKAIILGKYHYILYFLVLAMQPRMLMTVDENMKPLSVPVRVGQAVDVVGQAGRPKSITGFQTHSTPVLLAAGDRAELATEKYIPLSSILEGFVILKENPDYREDN